MLPTLPIYMSKDEFIRTMLPEYRNLPDMKEDPNTPIPMPQFEKEKSIKPEEIISRKALEKQARKEGYKIKSQYEKPKVRIEKATIKPMLWPSSIDEWDQTGINVDIYSKENNQPIEDNNNSMQNVKENQQLKKKQKVREEDKIVIKITK